MSPQDPPFEGYDELTAEQVLERLATLGADEVAAVKAYEAAHKDRKSIAGFGVDQAELEPFKPEGRPTAQEVAEQAAADEYVHDLTEEEK